MRYGKIAGAAIKAALICAFIAEFSYVCAISPGEVLKATPGELDLGTIEEGKPAVATASIENTGTVPVEITNVSTN
jgi:hypothetical protein